MKRQNNFKKQKGKRNTEGIVKIPFTFVIDTAFAASATAVQYDLAIQTVASTTLVGTRITAIALNYEYYKCVRLQTEILPFTDTVVTGNSIALAYKPAIAGVTDSSSYDAISETIPSKIYSENSTTPCRFNIPKRFLTDNPAKWFPTALTTATAFLDATQGHYYIKPLVAATIAHLTIRFTGDILFKNPTIGSADLMILYKELKDKTEVLKRKLEIINS